MILQCHSSVFHDTHPCFSINLRASVQQQTDHVSVATLRRHMKRSYPILQRGEKKYDDVVRHIKTFQCFD